MSRIIRINKTNLILSILIVLFFSSYVTPYGQDGSWKQGEFAIYIFKVGQGDSQLIISPSGETLLIDVAEMSWNSKKGANLVADKLREARGENFSHVDYVVASHLHLDHIGYAEKGGIWALVEKKHFTMGKLIDRDSAEWIDFDEDGEFDPPEELYWNNAGTVPGTAIHWLTYVLDPSNKSKLHREVAKKGDKTQINLGSEVVVEIVQCDGLDVKMADGTTPVSGDHRSEKYLPSENDYSITLKISYKELDYVSGGDTDGEYKISDFGYSYNDVESAIAPLIGEIEILHVNHHGSSHSSNQQYLDTLKPTVSLISCGKNSYGHPDQGTLDRILSISKLYLTEKGDPGRNYKSSIVVDGDIVIKSTDGINFTVNGDPYTVKQD
jgi:beta-lactamase superfamily II metal-dependent hydrolase